jgi:2-polyprenyl-3-methyl-5-hydroxy-6-metoxy-1,4-benzoquinol methylase
MGIEREPEWYNKGYKDNLKNIKKHKGEKGGLYREVYKLFTGTNVLDLGCGVGRFAKVLKENNFKGEYKGIDFSKNAIKFCKKTFSYEFETSNIFDIIIEDKYDIIILLEVLEHINNDIDFISMIPSNKTIILSVPSFGGPSHVRYFKSIEDVKKRYNKLIEFNKEKQIDKIFLLKGKRI